MLHRRYRFEPQDHGFDPGDQPIDDETGKGAGTIVAHRRRGAGSIELKRSAERRVAASRSRSSRRRRSRAARRTQAHAARRRRGHRRRHRRRRSLPRRPGHAAAAAAAARPAGWAAPLVEPGEDVLDGCTAARARARRRRRCRSRDRRAPARPTPAARMIVDLVARREDGRDHRPVPQDDQQPARGRRWRPRPRRASPVRAVQKADEDDEHVGHLDGVTRVGDNADVAAALAAGTVDVVAGTRWLLARPEFDDAFDVLFVDEASQMSLANAVALGTCARSIVLIGDPNQLPMVTPGRPPGRRGRVVPRAPRRRGGDGAARSRPVPGDLAPAAPGRQRVHLAGVLRGPAGDAPGHGAARRRWRRSGPVRLRRPLAARSPHAGNGPRSREEAEVVADAVEPLTGMTWQDATGRIRPHRASTTSSSSRRTTPRSRRSRPPSSDASGGAATSAPSTSSRAARASSRSTRWRVRAARTRRATWASCTRATASTSRSREPQCVAMLVASPTLLEAGCRTPEQMRMVDALCRFVEVASPGRPSAADEAARLSSAA